MDYTDIIVYAAIAAFVLTRLWLVLGQRNGDEPQRPNPFVAPAPVARDEEDVMVLPDRARVANTSQVTASGKAAASLAGILEQIGKLDPAFDEKAFLEGAKVAFVAIVQAFAKGDLVEVERLLALPVRDQFRKAIAARRDAGQTLEGRVERFSDVELASARLEGTRALLAVAFVSQQTLVLRDAAGQVISGADGQTEEVCDHWVFARDLASADPNWQLVETKTT